MLEWWLRRKYKGNEGLLFPRSLGLGLMVPYKKTRTQIRIQFWNWKYLNTVQYILGKWNFQTEFFIFQDFLKPVIKTMSLKFVTIFEIKISFKTRWRNFKFQENRQALQRGSPEGLRGSGWVGLCPPVGLAAKGEGTRLLFTLLLSGLPCPGRTPSCTQTHSCLRKISIKTVLRIRIRDPVPFWPLDPGSGIGFFQIPDLGSQTHIIESLVTIFWIKCSIILWKLA